ncbi:MAG TPA: amidase [Gammaproteobacteria bacterium]|nr:amidase [Gammaproteobacteria bacterium]|tara:strand:- start:1578 stop:2990 length:1413 start_codon:yes stop_codon:yes gene_type:complete
MTTGLCYQSATELVRLIRGKEVSAVDVLESHLQQIEAINPSVNAIVTLAADHGRRLAKEVDTKLCHGEDPGLLAGLPIAHKDLVDTKNIRTTYGSRIFANHIPDQNSPIVDTLIGAGAVTIGKTNTPEFGAGSQTFNEVFGATLNPYDLAKTCGGSSGGAAVALATRMLPIADGSDLGGSLRNPANFCNVVGFRTSAGRVPDTWNSLRILGPLARTVSDCALLLNVMAKPNPAIALSSSLDHIDFTKNLERDFRGTRIALSSDFGGQLPVDRAVQKVVSDSAVTFRNLGCEAENICPDLSEADDIFKTLRAWIFANDHGEIITRHPDLVKETIIWNTEQGKSLTGEDIYLAENARAELFKRVQGFMQEFEFLVLPVSQVPPFDVEQEYISEIDGVEMETYIDWMKSCYLVSATGLPAISVPAGFTPSGLPVGIQIVGRHYQEHAVLQLAKAFEQETKFNKRLPDQLEHTV